MRIIVTFLALIIHLFGWSQNSEISQEEKDKDKAEYDEIWLKEYEKGQINSKWGCSELGGYEVNNINDLPSNFTGKVKVCCDGQIISYLNFFKGRQLLMQYEFKNGRLNTVSDFYENGEVISAYERMSFGPTKRELKADSVFNSLPNAGGLADSLVDIEKFNIGEFQRLVIFHINLQRDFIERDSIVLEPEISKTCMTHTQWMADKRKLEHSRDGGGVCRFEVILNPNVITSDGITYSRFAYNTVHLWMTEPSHKDAIMEPSVTEAGVGISTKCQSQYVSVRLR